MSISELKEAFTSIVDNRLRGVHVSMPARIQAYKPGTNRATVQPLIKRGYLEDGVRKTESLPPIPNVPIAFFGSSVSGLTFPVGIGDTVWLIFSDFALDTWMQSGSISDPIDDRNHDLGDAIAYPADFKAQDIDTQAVVLSGDIKLGSKDASDPVALKSDLETLKTAINNAPTTGGDGGAAFKAALVASLSSWPTCSKKVKAE